MKTGTRVGLIAAAILIVGGMATGIGFASPIAKSSTTTGVARLQSERAGATLEPATWLVAPAPVLSGTNLNGVSCVNASSCVAVGDYQIPNGVFTLVESWDGRSWSIVPSPNPLRMDDNVLNGVSCINASDCVAVGSAANTDGGNSQTLIEIWNGRLWSIVPSPNPINGSSPELLDVSCASVAGCMAVGDSSPTAIAFGDSFVAALAESWNGRSWAIVPTPPEVLGQFGFVGPDVLDSVSCISTADCTAAGATNRDSHPDDPLGGQALVESWNGTAWSDIAELDPIGVPSQSGSVLQSLSCVNAAACTAVGTDSPQPYFPNSSFQINSVIASANDGDVVDCPQSRGQRRPGWRGVPEPEYVHCRRQREWQRPD